MALITRGSVLPLPARIGREGGGRKPVIKQADLSFPARAANCERCKHPVRDRERQRERECKKSQSKSQEIHTNPVQLRRVLSFDATEEDNGRGNFSRATVNVKPDKNQQQLLRKQLNRQRGRREREGQRWRRCRRGWWQLKRARCSPSSWHLRTPKRCSPDTVSCTQTRRQRERGRRRQTQLHRQTRTLRCRCRCRRTQVSKIKRKADSRCSFSSSSCCCCFSFNLCPWLFLLMFFCSFIMIDGQQRGNWEKERNSCERGVTYVTSKNLAHIVPDVAWIS